MINVNLRPDNYYLCYEIYDFRLLSFENGRFHFSPTTPPCNPQRKGRFWYPSALLLESSKYASKGFKFCLVLWKHFQTDPMSENAGWEGGGGMECPNTWHQISAPCLLTKWKLIIIIKTLPSTLDTNWDIYFMIKRLSTYIVMKLNNNDPLFFIHLFSASWGVFPIGNFHGWYMDF